MPSQATTICQSDISTKATKPYQSNYIGLAALPYCHDPELHASSETRIAAEGRQMHEQPLQKHTPQNATMQPCSLCFSRKPSGDLRMSRVLQPQSDAVGFLVTRNLRGYFHNPYRFRTLRDISSAVVHGIRCKRGIHDAKKRKAGLTYRSHYRTRSARALTRRHHQFRDEIHLQPHVTSVQLLAHSIARWSNLFALPSVATSTTCTVYMRR